MKVTARIPSLAMLRAFDAFGRTGGIRKAAQVLNVDHAVISRHLSGLEAFLGTALIDRSGTTPTLNGDGVEYHRRISAALQEIATASYMLRKRHDQQLFIWCAPGLAYHWLSPRLSLFLTPDSEIAVELRPMDYGPDFTINEADGDIRYVRYGITTEPPGGCRWAELVRPPVYPVASPSYAEAISERLHHVRDMLNMRLLHEESDIEWRLWFGNQGIEIPPATIAGPRLWHAHLMLDAAKTGQGIALANDLLIRNDLASGQLVKLVPNKASLKTTYLGGYYFTAREDRWHHNAIARFRNWLLSIAQQA